jgi:hypothetical protein
VLAPLFPNPAAPAFGHQDGGQPSHEASPHATLDRGPLRPKNRSIRAETLGVAG